jgi:hypothetical protein
VRCDWVFFVLCHFSEFFSVQRDWNWDKHTSTVLRDRIDLSILYYGMSPTDWALAAVLSVPGLALAVWVCLLRREMKDDQEKKKRH